MSQITKTSARLPNPFLDGADWGDCFVLAIAGRKVTAPEGAEAALGRIPSWIRVLMNARNRLVGLIGLKPAPDPRLGPDQAIGAFPVVSRNDRVVVLGLDDWHLDFRLVIEAAEDGLGGTILQVTTLVRRHNILGRVYLACVRPFHALIVPATLRGVLQPR